MSDVSEVQERIRLGITKNGEAAYSGSLGVDFLRQLVASYRGMLQTFSGPEYEYREESIHLEFGLHPDEPLQYFLVAEERATEAVEYFGVLEKSESEEATNILAHSRQVLTTYGNLHPLCIEAAARQDELAPWSRRGKVLERLGSLALYTAHILEACEPLEDLHSSISSLAFDYAI